MRFAPAMVVQAIAAVVHVTGNSFPLLQRLFNAVE